MSRPRIHPVFVAQPAGETAMCGHQHNSELQAVNCARNILCRRRLLDSVDALKIDWSGKREQTTSETMLKVTRDAFTV